MLASPASASSVSASRLAERGAPSTTLAHEAAMTGEADRTCGKARGEAEKENSDVENASMIGDRVAREEVSWKRPTCFSTVRWNPFQGKLLKLVRFHAQDTLFHVGATVAHVPHSESVLMQAWL